MEIKLELNKTGIDTVCRIYTVDSKYERIRN